MLKELLRNWLGSIHLFFVILLLLVSDLLVCYFGAKASLSAMDTICTVLLLHLAEVFVDAKVGVLVQVLT